MVAHSILLQLLLITPLVLAKRQDDSLDNVTSLRELTNDATAFAPVCPALEGAVTFAQKAVASHPGVTDSGACCILCTTTPSICQGWTVNKTGCFMYNSLEHQITAPAGTQSGYRPDVPKRHYANPVDGSSSCLAEEMKMQVTSESGAFCSAPCFPGTSSAQCPGDFPNGTTATPSCAIRDMIGQGSHCVLACSTDADCGGADNVNFKCMEAYSTKFCSYTKTTEIKLVWGTTCPTGWAELEATKGMVLTHAPSIEIAATTNGEPALEKGEKGRVGPHGHDIVDPGHAHNISISLGQDFHAPHYPSFCECNPRNTQDDTTQAPDYIDGTKTDITITPTTTPYLPLAYVLVCQQL